MFKSKKSKINLFVLLTVSIFIAIKASSITNSLDHWLNSSFCNEPITYRIGNIDDSFEITPGELKDYVNTAAEIWATAYGKELFVYDEDSNLEINLVYDERQKILEKINESESNLELQKDLVVMSNETFENNLKVFESKVSKLNEEIDYWNEKGGAPSEEYDKLIQRQRDLEKEGKELNISAHHLNKDIEDVNNSIEGLNKDVGYFNQLLGFQPEIGIYTSGERRIDVFFYENEQYLINVLAHEMGHALGLGHIDNEGAIMNPILSENTELKPEDIELINSFCSEKNRFDLIKNDLSNFVYTLLSKISLMLRKQ